MTLRPPTSTLFPYTTLFRSEGFERRQVAERRGCAARLQPPLLHQVEEARAEGEREDRVAQDREHDVDRQPGAVEHGRERAGRSEERRVGKECRSRGSADA